MYTRKNFQEIVTKKLFEKKDYPELYCKILHHLALSSASQIIRIWLCIWYCAGVLTVGVGKSGVFQLETIESV